VKKLKIPTQDDFVRAKKTMAYRDRNWDEISREARAALGKIFDLHELSIFPNDCEFEAILFFKTNGDMQRAASCDAAMKARSVLSDVIRPFRPECAEIEITIELDSHENVTANFNGSYFARLR